MKPLGDWPAHCAAPNTRRFHVSQIHPAFSRPCLLAVVAACVTSQAVRAGTRADHAAGRLHHRRARAAGAPCSGTGCRRPATPNIDFVGGAADGGGCNPGSPTTSTTRVTAASRPPASPSRTSCRRGWPPPAPTSSLMHLGTNDMWGGYIPLRPSSTAFTKLVGQMRAQQPEHEDHRRADHPDEPVRAAPPAPPTWSRSTTRSRRWAAGLTTAQSPINVGGPVDRLRRGRRHLRRVHPRRLRAS